LFIFFNANFFFPIPTGSAAFLISILFFIFYFYNIFSFSCIDGFGWVIYFFYFIFYFYNFLSPALTGSGGLFIYLFFFLFSFLASTGSRRFLILFSFIYFLNILSFSCIDAFGAGYLYFIILLFPFIFFSFPASTGSGRVVNILLFYYFIISFYIFFFSCIDGFRAGYSFFILLYISITSFFLYRRVRPTYYFFILILTFLNPNPFFKT